MESLLEDAESIREDITELSHKKKKTQAVKKGNRLRMTSDEFKNQPNTVSW